MIKRLETFVKQAVLLIDISSITLSFIASYFLRLRIEKYVELDYLFGRGQLFKDMRPLQENLWMLLILIPLWVTVLHLTGAYTKLRTKTNRQTVWIILKTSFLGLIFFGTIVFFLRLQVHVSRPFIMLFALFSFSSLSLERTFLNYYWRTVANRDFLQRKILVVGTGPRARSLIKKVRAHEEWGLRMVGILDKEPKWVGEVVEGLPVLGTLDELDKILRSRVVDEVLFFTPRSWMAEIEKAVLTCEAMGVRATVAIDFFNLNFARADASDLAGTPIVSFETTPADQWQLAIKRLLDFLISAISLALLLPLFLILAILIKATSPGPIFFRQIRAGLNGRRFTLYKFRSMVADAEAKQPGLKSLNEMEGPVFKLANDPRLTPIGKWLRRTSVDELPQLINVIKGEMSLVGPRPPLPEEVLHYAPWQMRRISMRPGITGYWQVMGRNRIKDFNRWAQLDLKYIDQWSILLDLKIFLKTIPVVLFGWGAK